MRRTCSCSQASARLTRKARPVNSVDGGIKSVEAAAAKNCPAVRYRSLSLRNRDRWGPAPSLTLA